MLTTIFPGGNLFELFLYFIYKNHTFIYEYINLYKFGNFLKKLFKFKMSF